MPTKVSKFLVAWSAGRQNVIWPFGRLEITDDELHVYSWHWTRWISRRVLQRTDIQAIHARKRSGLTTLTVETPEEQESVRILPGMSTPLVKDKLLLRGYPLGS